MRRPLKMERRHFRYIAEILQELEISKRQRLRIAVVFAAKLAHTSTNFKYQTFIEYAMKPTRTNDVAI